MPSTIGPIIYICLLLMVVGAIPLIWNLIKVLVIRRRLLHVIVPNVRSYYRLISNPVAGTVTVVALSPTLPQPGLWAEPDLHKKSRVDPKAATSIPLPRPRHLCIPWMDIVRRRGLSLDHPTPDEWGYMDLDEQRFQVDIDMQIEPLMIGMEWAQFVWLTLSLGVNCHDPAFTELLKTFSGVSGGNVNFSEEIILRDSVGMPVMRISGEQGKMVAKVARMRHVYDLRSALAADHIMIFTPEKDRNNSVMCRSLTEYVKFQNIKRIDRFGMWLKTNEMPIKLEGSSLQACEDPLASTLLWVVYSINHHFDGTVSQEVLDMREKSLLYLENLRLQGQLRQALNEMFPGGKGLPLEIEKCILDAIDSSQCKQTTLRCLRDWDQFLNSLRSLSRRMKEAKTSVSGPSPPEREVVLLRRYLSRLRRLTLPGDHMTVLVSERREGIQARNLLWTKLKQHPTWKQLQPRLEPGRDLGKQHNSPMFTTLTHTLIALMTWDRCPRTTWTLAPEVGKVVAEALDTFSEEKIALSLSKDGKGEDEKTIWDYVDSLPPGRELFRHGGFRAPVSPLRSVFGSEPEMRIRDDLKVYVL